MDWSLFILALMLFTSIAADTFTNPIKSYNGADPSMLYTTDDGGWYYLVNTENNSHMELMRGRTLNELKGSARKILLRTDSRWSRTSALWAPEIHQINGTWYLYYTSHEIKKNQPNRYRPWVGKWNGSPWEGFLTILNEVKMDEDIWGIDGSIIHFPHNPEQLYFIWSAPNQAGVQSINIAPMSDPMTVGPRHIISSPQYEWEKIGNAVNEGPHALYYKDKVFITFSASLCSTPEYSLGLLTWNGGDPLTASSWEKHPNSVLSAANGNYDTGHNGFFRSPDGEQVWTVFHASKYSSPDPRACGVDRYTMVEPLTFDNAGNPQFTQPQPLDMAQQVPSGEGKLGLGVNPLLPQN